MVSTWENGTRILKHCWNRLKPARVRKNKGGRLTMLLRKMMSRTLNHQSPPEILKRRTTQWLRFLEWTGTLSKTIFSSTSLICAIMECHFRRPSVLFWSCQQWYLTRWDFSLRALWKWKFYFRNSVSTRSTGIATYQNIFLELGIHYWTNWSVWTMSKYPAVISDQGLCNSSFMDLATPLTVLTQELFTSDHCMKMVESMFV